MSGVEWVLESPEETFRLGECLGSLLHAGDCVALTGELGAGKTHLTKALAAGMGVTQRVLSPTFNLLLEYQGRVVLRHLDAYFAAREAALLDEACHEVFGSDGVAVVEWAEKIETYLPSSRVEIAIEIEDAQRRRIRVWGRGERGAQLVHSLDKLLREKKIGIRQDLPQAP